MSGPVVARSRAELAAARDALRGRVAVVMTMGALHDGHVRLLETARDLAERVIVTIFVNPLQFGAGEDLERYPRNLTTDLAVCAAHGVDVVFAPSVEEMYPPEQPVPQRHAGAIGERFEGAARPGHFDGMLTVVGLLLDLTRPDVAIFGEKDAQQLALIRRLVADEGKAVQLVGVPTVREPDGLAMSSRNRYLSPAERPAALSLSRALRAGAAAAAEGAAAATAAARAVLDATPDLSVDYLAVIDDESWDDPRADTRQARILVAGRVGSTRLIDNVPVVLGTQDSAG